MINLKDFLFYAIFYFIIGGIISSLNYFYYVFKSKNNYDIIEGPGEQEFIIFMCFPLFLISVLINYWFDFIKWLALKFKK